MVLSARTFALALAASCPAVVVQPAIAQSDYGTPNIMIEEGGRPLKRSPGIVIDQDGKPVKKKAEPKVKPRGSSYVPPMTLPRTEPVVVAPASPGVYRPPPINSFGDRVIGCNHSFPLNSGIGNNPTDRSAYVRQCAN